MESIKAKQYLIDNLEIVKGCDVLMVSTVTATEAIEIAEKELKEKAIVIFNELIFEIENNPYMTIDKALELFNKKINQ